MSEPSWLLAESLSNRYGGLFGQELCEYGREDDPCHAKHGKVTQRLGTGFTIEETDPVFFHSHRQPKPDDGSNRQLYCFAICFDHEIGLNETISLRYGAPLYF